MSVNSGTSFRFLQTLFRNTLGEGPGKHSGEPWPLLFSAQFLSKSRRGGRTAFPPSHLSRSIQVPLSLPIPRSANPLVCEGCKQWKMRRLEPMNKPSILYAPDEKKGQQPGLDA